MRQSSRDRAVELIAGIMLEHGGVDMTSEPPGDEREDYARSLAERILDVLEDVDA